MRGTRRMGSGQPQGTGQETLALEPAGPKAGRSGPRGSSPGNCGLAEAAGVGPRITPGCGRASAAQIALGLRRPRLEGGRLAGALGLLIDHSLGGAQTASPWRQLWWAGGLAGRRRRGKGEEGGGGARGAGAGAVQ